MQLPALPHSHIEMEWGIPEWRRGYELAASVRTVVRYDARGTGLSERNVDDFSLDRMLVDLEAVVDAVGPGPLALFGVVNSCPIAVAFASRFPERVSHLVLWCPVVDTSIHLSNPMLIAARQIIETDWSTYSQMVAHGLVGWSESDSARRFAELVRAGIDQHRLPDLLDQMHTYDVRPLLPTVRCPTLVLHRTESALLDLDAVDEVAAALPDARVSLFEGSSASPCVGDWRSIVRSIESFLTDGSDKPFHDGRARRRLRMGSDALTGREREVTGLVVKGLTNREIATELVLAEKTVEHHVSRILLKLDLRSRTQLAARAVRLGLSGPG